MIVRKLDRKVCKRHVRTTIDCKTKDLNHTLALKDLSMKWRGQRAVRALEPRDWHAKVLNINYSV